MRRYYKLILYLDISKRDPSSSRPVLIPCEACDAGGQIGATPRGGDELAASGQLAQAEREGRAGQGWTSILAGGDEWATGCNTDLGYVFR